MARHWHGRSAVSLFVTGDAADNSDSNSDDDDLAMAWHPAVLEYVAQ
jgi:hypothetical protein